MAKFNIKMTIEAKDEAQAMEIANGFQTALNKVDGNSLSKMLQKLAKNPHWISIAKKFC